MGLMLILKRARRLAPQMRKRKQTKAPACTQRCRACRGAWRRGSDAEAPDVGQHAGRDAEGDDVGEGVELTAEVAGGVGDAGDAAVQRVEEDGKADGQGGEVEVVRLLATEPWTLCVMAK